MDFKKPTLGFVSLNGRQAEAFLDSLASTGKLERLSKPGRTKAVIYRTSNERVLAVIPESDPAKLVLERRPKGQDVIWDDWLGETGAEATGSSLRRLD